jgi:hypothetical protein
MVARDLTAYAWHTGGPVRALHEGERCPALYRDLGAVAMLRLLRGQLPRLAGPASPVTYMRTAHYVEPYTDHEHFGRVMLLPFGAWTPWHAGIADVYVTDADARFDPLCMDVVPDDRDLAALAREASRITSVDELYEALGPHHFEWKLSLARRLDGFTGELARVEAAMTPLRAAYQSQHDDVRRRARDRMGALSLTERDLCAPWHHLPRGRRDEVLDVLARGALWP